MARLDLDADRHRAGAGEEQEPDRGLGDVVPGGAGWGSDCVAAEPCGVLAPHLTRASIMQSLTISSIDFTPGGAGAWEKTLRCPEGGD